ncbi:hypothetical protein [Pseudaminobacter sp. NGMCC 1.201702]|uniref:hypothetical protein n=1 Tax=Pseudaminobacter sp. NGMCC 1.201702 TaxID=3391825 RepID=UPI0039EE5CE2
MNPIPTDSSKRRGVKSVALLWFAVFLAAVHALAGGTSTLRSARLLAEGPASAASEYAGGERTTLVSQQRNIAIADWQNSRPQPAQAGGDADPAVVPPEIRAAQLAAKHFVAARHETFALRSAARGFSARAPPSIV